MLNNILANGTTLSNLSLISLLSLISGLILAFSYKLSEQSSKGFLLTVSLLPLIVMAAVIIVNGNLGIGLTVAGIFQLTRFRSLPGKAQDIAVVFAAMVCGLAGGAGYPWFSLVLSTVVSVIVLIFSRTNIFVSKGDTRYIKIQVPDYMGIDGDFENTFKEHCSSFDCISMKTEDLGTIYELIYQVKMKTGKTERQLIDALRVLNGNLPISSTVYGPTMNQL